MCNVYAQGSRMEMMVTFESEALHFLPSLCLGVFNRNIFIATVEGIYLPDVKEPGLFREWVASNSKVLADKP